MNAANVITAERLREVLAYNPETGVFKWTINPSRAVSAGAVAGNKDVRGYIIIGIDRCRYRAHRLAWLYMTHSFPPEEIDHINGDPSDNRWINLRAASRGENACNRRGKNKLKGVFSFRRKWRAQIRCEGIIHYLGDFDCPAAAYFSYIVASDKLHGEFARTQ